MRQARWTPRRRLQWSASEGTHPRPPGHPPSFLAPAQPRIIHPLHPPTPLPAFVQDPHLPSTHPPEHHPSSPSLLRSPFTHPSTIYPPGERHICSENRESAG
ncbi:unnamed protein product [Gulo gulo]|uniref:Uncharacterized protein n=1 Tax=Gulo gulo TaxID=48420 RepID=A0A9X9MAD2_GULGU|nr:unnamed protein product [Gulo gulo]